MATDTSHHLHLQALLERAHAGKEGGLSKTDCRELSSMLSKSHSQAQMPQYCSYILGQANRHVLARQNSRVGRTWNYEEGHGKRTLFDEQVPGGLFDNKHQGTPEPSLTDIYLASKGPDAREKIRKQVVRMASRGAHPRFPVQEEQVVAEREKEARQKIVRRKSRSQEIVTNEVFVA